MAESLKVGDIVSIPKFSSLFGERNPVSDFHVAKARFRVTKVDVGICGSDGEGWFDALDLVDEETGEDFPFMILNSQVRRVA